jgi:hypothetical protein
MTQPDAIAALRRNWFASIQELSDIDLQRRKWLDVTNRNPHWSYIEFTCSYPDSDQLEHAYLERWLTTIELEILSEVERAIDSYSAPKFDDYDNEAILADPAWHAVVEIAAAARQRLLAIIADAGERQALCASPSPNLSP